MAAIIETIAVGVLEVNCYIFADANTKDAAIIDPGADYKKIDGRIKKLGLTPRLVINTHGHADHIGANGAFNLPVFIHKLDADFLSDPVKNMSANFFLEVKSPKASTELAGGEKIKVGNLELEVIHTPGHTPGCLCLKNDGVLFTGDTLFYESVGRTDIPFASERDLYRSIKEKLLSLDDDVKVYPGHGRSSTIGHERKSNPFL